MSMIASDHHGIAYVPPLSWCVRSSIMWFVEARARMSPGAMPMSAPMTPIAAACAPTMRRRAQRVSSTLPMCCDAASSRCASAACASG